MLRTVPFSSGSGSAVDPLAAEITWAAWELVAADPARLSPEVVQNITMGFDCLVEAAWQPGRSVLLSEAEWTPAAAARGDGCLGVRLAVAVLGPSGSTQTEVRGLSVRAQEVLRRHHVLAARPVDPATVVAACDPTGPGPALDGHMVHIRQSTNTVGDDDDLVEVVSRFSPTIEPWSSVVCQLADLDRHVRVRATVLATELSPADRMEIEHGLSRVRAIRERNPSRAEIAFDTDRAAATLLDLRASFSSPILAAEIAVWSADPLSHTSVRSLAAAFTSESDVLRHQGNVMVASSRLLLGGFDVLAEPEGWASAQHVGLPLRGGLRPRSLVDLQTLTESPIGWPLPFRDGLPATSTQVPISRRTADIFQPAVDLPSSPLGETLDGHVVRLPLNLRTLHRCLSGTTGTGKSVAQRGQALDDLRHGRSFLYVDPHGTSADELIAHARWLGVDVVVIDAADGATDQMGALPVHTGDNQEAIEHVVRLFAAALASSMDNPEWTGPRWFSTFEALLEVVIVHEGELVDGVVWLNDVAELRQRLDHPQVSAFTRSTLLNLAGSTGDGADLRGWVSSKLHPVVSGTARRVIAPAGRGVDPGAAVLAGRPVIVNLSALSTTESRLIGHLALSLVLDAGFGRSGTDLPVITCYLEEAHHLPEAAMARTFAEARKFGIAIDIAVQSLNQLPPTLADLAMGAGIQVAFRATPDTAGRLSNLLQVPALDLTGQPDLHATVVVPGHAPASVVVAIPPTCPEPRVKAPLAPLPPSLSDMPAKTREHPRPESTVGSAGGSDQDTGGDGGNDGTRYLDEWLARKRELAARETSDDSEIPGHDLDDHDHEDDTDQLSLGGGLDESATT